MMLERRKGRGRRSTKIGVPATYDASCEAREGIPARRQQFSPTLHSRMVDEILRECPSKP